MKRLQSNAWDVVASALSLALCLPMPARAADDDAVAMRRAIEELREQNRALAARLAALEAERSGQGRPVRAARLAAVPRAPPPPAAIGAATERRSPDPAPAPNPAPTPVPADASPAKVAGKRDLEQRVTELEIAKTAQEDAVRGIVRSALSGVGSKINEFVTLGGALEVGAGWSRDFQRQSRDQISLNTAELDLEVRANNWTVGNLMLTYASGTDVLFPTTTGFRTGVDRLLVDKGTITVGDPQRFPLYFKGGIDYLPFGSSTGVARLDSLAINTPLTTEVFETRRTLAGFGFEFPTPAPSRSTPSQVVPAVRPLTVSPLVDGLARRFGYVSLPTRPKQPSPYVFPTEPPPFYGSLYLYDSNNIVGVNRKITDNVVARLGYRTHGNCGRPYNELQGSSFCPWSFDLSVDYNSSIFDSRFLEAQYRAFLQQIGYIPGMAATIKMAVGPVSIVGEVVGAIKPAKFTDNAGKKVNISPAAWQLALGYQFDWNPWVEAIGAQGTYVALGYSGSHDLAGVTQTIDGAPSLVGAVPKHRATVTAGEWILDGLKLALEYSHNWDYPRGQGGTGNQADGVFTSLTYTW